MNDNISNKQDEYIKNINENLLIFFNDLVLNLSNNHKIILEISDIITDTTKSMLDKNKDKSFFDPSDVDFFSGFYDEIILIYKNFDNIINGYKYKTEIFLTYDIKELLNELKRIDIDTKFIGYYYLLLIRIIIFVWKNEINLLDETMSKHHRNKSINDIRKVYNELNSNDNDKINILKDKTPKEFELLLQYIKFFLFKFDNDDLKIKEDEITNYTNNIEFIKLLEDNDYKKNFDENSELDLYLKFNNFKKEKYSSKSNDCYKKLKLLYNEYCKSFKPKNRTYFLNNLISILGNENFDAPFIIEELKFIHDELDSISDILNDENNCKITESYFTKFKLSKIYRILGQKTLNLEYFADAKKYISNSIEIFESNNGAYFPFDISDINLYDESIIHTFTGPFIPEKTDYHLKLKEEQMNIISKETEVIVSKKEKQLDENIKNIESTIKKNIKNIESTIEKNNTKTVEILAVFSAIILFMSGSIQIFQYLYDLQSAIYFIIGFGASLTFFIILILFVTKGDNMSFKNNKFLYSYLIGYLLFVIFFTFTHSSSISIKNQNFKDKLTNDVVQEIEQKLKINSNIGDLDINSIINKKLKEISITEGEQNININLNTSDLNSTQTNLNNQINYLK